MVGRDCEMKSDFSVDRSGLGSFGELLLERCAYSSGIFMKCKQGFGKLSVVETFGPDNSCYDVFESVVGDKAGGV